MERKYLFSMSVGNTTVVAILSNVSINSYGILTAKKVGTGFTENGEYSFVECKPRHFNAVGQYTLEEYGDYLE